MAKAADLPSGVIIGSWIHGVSGSGKTHAVTTAYPDCYRKGCNKWWDGYQGEEVAFLDDIDPNGVKFLGRFIKIWADRYAFVAEDKGGAKSIRPRKLIITSQYSIERCCEHVDQETKEAFLRRFVEIEKVQGQNIILV